MKETNIHTQTIIHKAWNASEGRFDHSFVFAFRTRTEYLEFRRGWKQNYAALSQAIRGLKALIKATMRQREQAGPHQSDLQARKAEATLQLAMRRSAKAEANRQYRAARPQVNG